MSDTPALTAEERARAAWRDCFTGPPVKAIASAIREAEDAAYLAGFKASGEGWNGEYPFNDLVRPPAKDAGWLSSRDENLGRLKATKGPDA